MYIISLTSQTSLLKKTITKENQLLILMVKRPAERRESVLLVIIAREYLTAY